MGVLGLLIIDYAKNQQSILPDNAQEAYIRVLSVHRVRQRLPRMCVGLAFSNAQTRIP